MPDITLCASKKCRRKKTCYRAKVNIRTLWQSYSDFYEKGKKCGYYMGRIKK